MCVDETRPRHFLGLVSLIALLSTAPAFAEISGDSWLPIGPAPGTFGDFRDVSGRATVIAPNPLNADDLWLGTAQGGVWHSLDGGASWTPETDDQESLAIGAIALSGCLASGCSRVFVGTGENAIRRDTFYGQGLLLGRLNGGQYDWEIKKGSPYDFSYASINDVLLDPTTSGSQTKIFLTLSSGVTASSTQSTVTAPEPAGGYGIYRSTSEGAAWDKLEVPESSGARPTDLEMDPSDPDTLYAGFLGRGIFKTTDGGDTWCPLGAALSKPPGCPDSFDLPAPSTFDFVEIATFAGNSQVLYATFGDCPDPLLAECRPEVWKTIDAGVHWTLMTEGVDPDNPFCMRIYSRYTHALTVHPTDPDTLLLGGITLCRSENGGLNWFRSQFQTGLEQNIHLDHRQIVFFADNPQIAFDVNDGGVARSNDSANTWTQINGNLQTIAFQSISSSPKTARVIGGAQDNSGQMWTGSSTWEELPCCGDGGFSVMDLDGALSMYVTSNQGDTDNTWVVPLRSKDGGSSFEALNAGLDASDPQSFYSPLVQDPSPPHLLYFGTNRLYQSDDDTASWTVVSPVLSVTPQTEIFSGQDVITAVAIAPSDPDRIYLGYYSGKVFVTDAPCSGGGCWTQKSDGLPSAPISWIAVDPLDPDTAYATLSGFFAGIHVYKTETGGNSWEQTAGTSQLDGVPANTLVIEPSEPDRLWLGTDVGAYRSICGGCLWSPANHGLPRVPVFQFSIDESRGRIFAGTHGRGAFIRTSPYLSSLEGWVDGKIWDIPLMGGGFLPGQNCTIRLARQDLTVCAEGTMDAFGGTPTTNDDGEFVSNKGFDYQGLDVVWACNQGTCVDDTPIEDCNEPGNQLAAVVVTCGQQVAIHLLSGCPSVTAPPSSWAGLTGLEDFRNAALPREFESGPAGAFEMLPVLFAGDGSTEILCRVTVSVQVDDSIHDVLLAAESLVDSDPTCIASGVTATLLPGREESLVEDLFAGPDHLKLEGPGLTGGQLVPSICTEPGQATGMCFELDKLGVPVLDLMQILRVRFKTAGGASGGEISLTERSLLGRCEHTILTSAGDTGNDIAQALEDAFQAPGLPGPASCRSAANPRDLFRHGDSVVTVLPTQLEICVSDPTVGFCAAPEEICFADRHCDDQNPCTSNVCDLATGQCLSSPLPNGSACNDSDPCTTGNICNAGACGVPLNCDDSNPCTEDHCQPATGGCSHERVICDDGNVCTQDSCLATSGACQFSPMTGTCNDGNLCTAGDICQFDPLRMVSTCRGTPKCADGDPCTDDVCDPLNGSCANPAHDCEDGNPCTIDFCGGGACASTFSVGMGCDDGDPCTQGDSCEFISDDIACVAQGPTCSDSDACTYDVCHPVFGTCTFPQVPLAGASGLLFSNAVRFSWTVTPDTIQSNTYRGTIPAVGLGNREETYDHVCFELGDDQRNGANITEDFEVPPPGEAFYYDNTLVFPCGEGPLGSDSWGTPRPAGSCGPVLAPPD